MSKPLYLLPGWGYSKQIWTPLRTALPPEVSCVPIGFEPTTTTDINIYAKQISKKIDGPLLGWSFGGLIGVKIARLFPKKIPILMLLCSTPCFKKAPNWSFGLSQKSRKLMVRLLANNRGNAWKHFCRLCAEGEPSSKELYRTLLTQQADINTATLKKMLIMLFESDLRADLAALDCPLAIFLGARDPLIDTQQITTALGSLKQTAQITVYDNTGHVPHLSHPAEIAAAICQFINANDTNKRSVSSS